MSDLVTPMYGAGKERVFSDQYSPESTWHKVEMLDSRARLVSSVALKALNTSQAVGRLFKDLSHSAGVFGVTAEGVGVDIIAQPMDIDAAIEFDSLYSPRQNIFLGTYEL